MVANVGEILEPEEQDEDAGQDGSGFNVKKVPGTDEKKEAEK